MVDRCGTLLLRMDLRNHYDAAECSDTQQHHITRRLLYILDSSIFHRNHDVGRRVPVFPPIRLHPGPSSANGDMFSESVIGQH